MANGSVLVVGGEAGSNGSPVPTLEILPTPAGGNTTVFLDFLLVRRLSLSIKSSLIFVRKRILTISIHSLLSCHTAVSLFSIITKLES